MEHRYKYHVVDQKFAPPCNVQQHLTTATIHILHVSTNLTNQKL